MKKIILLLLVLLLLVGCGRSIKKNKQEEKINFNCIKTISDGQSNISYEVIGEYKNSKLASAKNSLTISFEDSGIDNFELFKTYVELMNDEYNKIDGIKSSLTIDNNKINLVALYNISKMHQEEIVNNNFDKDYLTLINIYQEDGYTCK